MDLTTFLWLSAATVLAYFVKGFSGFGPALVFVPSVSYLFDPKTALVSSTLVDLVVGLGLAKVLTYDRAERKLVLRLALCMGAGSVAGATLADAVPAALLLRIITVVILGFGLSLALFHRPIPVRVEARSSRALDVGCVLGGITGGLVGISAPFVVLFARPLMEKGQFRRILVGLFLLEAIVRLSAYAVVGVWTGSTLTVALYALPAVLVGLVVGFRCHGRVDEKRFSVIVGLVLVALAMRLLFA